MATTFKNIKTYMSMNNRKEFYLDTNVLYWYCYPRYSTVLSISRKENIQPYYDFVDRLIQNGNPIITSVYNVSELLNVIEKNECEIYQRFHPEIEVSVKDLREMPEERKQLRKIMKIALNNVRQVCNVIGFEITENAFDQFVNGLERHRCDFFDYVVLENNIKNKHFNVITDDADFSSMDEIEIYTVNQKMLRDSNS